MPFVFLVVVISAYSSACDTSYPLVGEYIKKALLVDLQHVTLYLVAEARLEHATSRL